MALKSFFTSSYSPIHPSPWIVSVLVAGGHGCGKASLCRMLANWASRAGGTPLLVELGLSHGRVGFPGAVAATRCSSPPRTCYSVNSPHNERK